ncbi:hypothetical protein MAE02_55680 [Microvirga aerophila]|uniref:cGAS/DncV-like nucleotidyltransferase C-terminal helical domain-containing protein n=1 Tax=Microvirga aerophila TaxID=670291 RepID=A0A512C0Y5_9HYPH|nr:hypothetical protein MAE02_55680 [Microvirga aerophila]
MPVFSDRIREQYRRRREWNDRFGHWETAESNSETVRIERARDMVKSALAGNAWLMSEGVQFIEQGSFTNRTNVRGEADIDLRIQHPLIKVVYETSMPPLQQAFVDANLYVDAGRSLADVLVQMRREIGNELNRKFGQRFVDMSGNKAIRVKGLTDSRGEVDVVPAFELHLVGHSWTMKGAAILGQDGSWTFNYPDQHVANGRAKRETTGRQFKKVVRTVKRLRADMADRGIYGTKVPSFLIECLVYRVEDVYFTWIGDDRYDRVRRVLARALDIVEGSQGALYPLSINEINDVKPLFGDGQAWTRQDAIAFLRAALTHLGDA